MNTKTRIFKVVFSMDFVVITALIAWYISQLLRNTDMPSQFCMKLTMEHVCYIALYIANVRILYPRLENKYWGILYGLTLIALIAITVIINLWFGKLIDVHGAYAKHFADIGRPYWPNDHWTKTWIIILSGLMLGLSYVSSVARKLQRNQLAFALSEKERVLAELAFLKAQINPHFFFNTLHTIYALMDTNIGSAKTSIYSLSHMMRYVLYETKNELTTLSKEIEFIDDYIALMKVRIASNVQVIFEKPIGLNDLPIAPMLFLPFIENAFKHGISAVTPSYISIDIFKKNKKLVFEVRNSLFNGMAKQLDDEHGIGIANTRRRLDLIYPDKYDLVVERDDFAREFIVTLTLNIDDN